MKEAAAAVAAAQKASPVTAQVEALAKSAPAMPDLGPSGAGFLDAPIKARMIGYLRGVAARSDAAKGKDMSFADLEKLSAAAHAPRDSAAIMKDNANLSAAVQKELKAADSSLKKASVTLGKDVEDAMTRSKNKDGLASLAVDAPTSFKIGSI